MILDIPSHWYNNSTLRYRSFLVFLAVVIGILAVPSAFVHAASKYTWTVIPGSPVRPWSAFAASADGTKLVGVDADLYGHGLVFISSDRGQTWATSTIPQITGQWSGAAVSASGTTMLVTANSGSNFVYESDDGGASWAPQAGTGSFNWSDAAVSADGTKRFAAPANGYIYVSTTTGMWTPLTGSGSRQWARLRVSADGSKVYAIDGQYNTMYVSLNSGNTWTQKTLPSVQYAYGLALSADGMKLVLSSYGDDLYTSVDGGTTWTDQTALGAHGWGAVDSSADGSRIVATADGEYVYTSIDGGANWLEETTSQIASRYVVAASADGLTFVTSSPTSQVEIGTGDFIVPLITGVASTQTTTTATVTWTTNEPATSQVIYGTTPYTATTTLDTTLATSHSVALTGLSPSTLYHFAVVSQDAAVNQATSSDYTLTTSANAASVPSVSSHGVSGQRISVPQPESSPQSAPVTSQICTPYLTGYIRLGAANDPDQVRKLQTFLNEKQGESLAVDGIYSQADSDAVKRFQAKYHSEILGVWGLSAPTGYIYRTTIMKINSFYCSSSIVCPYFNEYNSPTQNSTSPEVGKTKELLSELGFYSGTTTDTFDISLQSALKNFQNTFKQTMLTPWGIAKGTGYKYKTTNKFLNMLVGCKTPAVILDGKGTFDY